MLNILQVVADGRPGGGTTMVLGLIDELRLQGGCANTVISQPGSYLQAEVERRGCPFLGLDFFSSMFDLRLPWRLHRLLKGQRFEVAHLHGLRAAHHAVQWPVRSAMGRFVYTVHGLHQFNLAPHLRAMANLAERRVMSRVDVTAFVSLADSLAAQRWRLMPPGATTRVVLNGIDLSMVGAHQGGSAEHDVAFVGRLEAQKDPLSAARALAALGDQGYRCVLAGDGPLNDECTRLLSTLPGGDRVRRLGALSHDEALRLISKARVLVMPSRWEGLPILPMEAMALGVPVVASRLPGIEEVMPHGEGGLLVPVGDVEAAVQAVQALLVDGLPRDACLRAGASRVARYFDRRQTARQYLDLYERVLS